MRDEMAYIRKEHGEAAAAAAINKDGDEWPVSLIIGTTV